MDVERNDQESMRYHELIADAKEKLSQETVGTQAYNEALKNLKDLQTLKTMTDNVVINDRKVESKADKWFNRGIKILGVIAPVFVTGLMIWWDRSESGGHIMNQYINPALRAGDGAK